MVNLVLTFIGPPGAGKGHFSYWIVKKFGFKRLASGDITRKYADEPTEIGLKISKLMERGELLPDELISQLFFLELEKIHSNVVLDGFPRTKIQGVFLHTFLRKKMSKNKFIVIILKTKKEDSAYRVQGRLFCAICSATYHPKLSPPRESFFCDNDNTKLSRRADDEHFAERWATYERKTLPLIKFMKARVNPKNLFEIGSDLSKEEIKKILEKIVEKN